MRANKPARYDRLFDIMKDYRFGITSFEIIRRLNTVTPSKCVSELRDKMGKGRFTGWKWREWWVKNNSGKDLKKYMVERA